MSNVKWIIIEYSYPEYGKRTENTYIYFNKESMLRFLENEKHLSDYEIYKVEKSYKAQRHDSVKLIKENE